MSLLDRIYNQSPVWLQNVMCSTKGYIIGQRRYGKLFYKVLNEYETKSISTEQKLIELLEVSKYVAAYRDYITPKLLTKVKRGGVIEELKKLPIITKEDVKAHYSDFVNVGFNGKVTMAHTSGTTGSGLSFPYSVEMENRQWAVWWRYRRELGINIGTWCGWFGGRMIISPDNKRYPYWRINYPGKQVMFSMYHLNNQTVNDYHHEIKTRCLSWLHGYPSTITQLASLIVEAGLPSLDCVQFITTGAENLYDYQIQLMKTAFPNAMVRTHYGLSEGVANMSQDREGKWNIDNDFSFVEFIPLNPSNPTLCRIVGTNLANYTFPLIRYDTGDIATVEWNDDGKPIVLSIDGRKDDYITLPNGIKLGRLDFLFKGQANIREAQIHQKNLHHIILNVVKGEAFSKLDESTLLADAHHRFGSEVNVEINYVEKIKRTASGKLRLVISDVK